ncbi:MAG: hypothetical protein IPI97_15435 [Nitrosomonas sp.]|nr:hypothetical protein [Nitrosomonas sp.]
MMFYLIFSIGLLLPRIYRLPYVLVAMVVLQMGMHKLSPAWKFMTIFVFMNSFRHRGRGGLQIVVAQEGGAVAFYHSIYCCIRINYLCLRTRGMSGVSQLLQVSIPCAVIVAVFIAPGRAPP